MSYTSRILGMTSVVAICIASGPALAQARQYDITAQPLGQAILEFSRQSDIVLSAPPELVKGKTSNSVSGQYNPQEAANAMLRGTGLTVSMLSDGGMQIRRTGAPGESASDKTLASETESASRDSFSMGDIIVTAQKREERILDVPSSIAVLSGDQLEKKGMVRMDDYLRVMPGVNSLDLGNSLKRIVFRGIGTDPEIERLTSAVYFGEAPVSVSSSAGNVTSTDLRMVDIERVEVLRGPQGTLYGASSLGGLLRQIPTKPKFNSFEGEVAGGYSSTQRLGGENTMLRGVINIPVVDNKIAVRAVAYRFFDSGYYENVAGSDPQYAAIAATYDGIARNERRVGDGKTYGGRIAVTIKPVDPLTIDLGYIKQRDNGGRTEAMQNVGNYQQTRMQTVLNGVVHSPDRKADVDIGSVVVNYDFGPINLLSSSSYIWKKVDPTYDLTAFFFEPISASEPARARIFTEELRMSSDLDGPFQFIGGLYYEKIKETFGQTVEYAGDSALSSNYGNGGNGILSLYDSKTVRTQIAAFGEITFNVTDHLSAKAGGRYFKYKSSLNTDIRGIFGTGTTGVSTKEDGKTFSASVDYKIDRDAMLYARWAQGFRPGIAVDNSFARSSQCDANNDGLVDGLGISAPDRIDSDSVDSYELGVKATLGGRFSFNAAAYRIDWQGIPLSVRAPILPCTAIVQINAGEARSQGVELEGSASLSSNFKLDFSAAYTDSKLMSDVPDLGGKKGDRLPATPKYKANVGLQYDLRHDPFDFFARADYSYISGFTNNVTKDKNSSDLVAGKYSQINLRTGVKFNRIGVDLFVNNLLNEVAYTWVGLRYANTAYFLRPRTAGIEVKYNF